jgi:hypothetical protein
MFRSILTTLLVPLLFVCFCSTLSADVITLKDGRKVEGEIVSQDSTKVTIKTKYGPVEFLMSDVAEIERKKTTDQIYKEMVDKTNPKDPKQLMELVKWCKKNKKSSQAKRHLKQIVSLDSNHEEAREMLGYVKFEGRWVTKKQLNKLQEKASDAEKEAKGLVKYKGEWLPKEDVEKLKKGLVQHEGKWVTAQEKERLEKDLVQYEGEWIPKEDAEKRKEGLFKINENWVKKKDADRYHSNWETPWRLVSDHILVVTNLPYDMGQKFIAEGEGAFKKAKAIFSMEPALAGGKIILYIAADRETYNMIGNQIGDQRSSSYSVFYAAETPESAPVTVTYFENENFTLGSVRHGVTGQILRRLGLKEAIPEWYVKGKAAKEERFFHARYISWSKKRLINQGGAIKMKQFFGNFGGTEREILHAGLVVAFLEDPNVPKSVTERFDEVKQAVKEGKKIDIAFAKLETLLAKAEKEFLSFYEKY